jgi:hypothetical protein
VTHEEDRSALAGHLAHLAEAFLLKRRVPDGEDFVDDDDVVVDEVSALADALA